MRAQPFPAGQAAFEAAVRHAVHGLAGAFQFDVVEQTFAGLREEDLEFLHRPGLVVDHPGVLDVRPWSLRGLVTAPPVRTEGVVGVSVDQLQAASVSIRPAPPTIAVGNLVHHDEVLERQPWIVRSREDHALAAVREFPGVISNGVGGVKLRVLRQEIVAVAGHDQVAPSRDDGSRWNHEIDSVHETPITNIHRLVAPVVEFHVFVLRLAGDWMVHDLVDHDVMQARRAVGRAGRGPRKFADTGGPVRPASRRHAIGLRPEPHRIDHPGAIAANQKDGLALAAQSETQVCLREHRPPARGEQSAGGNDKLVRVGSVAEPAMGEIDRLGGAVVQFDEVHLRRIAVGQELVDRRPVQRIGDLGIGQARGAPAESAGRPGVHRAFAVIGPRQLERVPRSVGGDRPRHLVFVLDFQQQGARAVVQTHLAVVVGQIARKWTDHIVHAGGLPQCRGVTRDDHKAAPGEPRAGGKSEVDVARNPIPAHLLRHRFRIEDLNVFQDLGATGFARVIHDLGDNERRAPAGRRELPQPGQVGTGGGSDNDADSHANSKEE